MPTFVVTRKVVVSVDTIVDADTQEEARILARGQRTCEAALHDAIQKGRFDLSPDGELVHEVDS